MSVIQPIQIGPNTVFVRGAKNAAIYNFEDSNVFSVNESAIRIIESCIIDRNRPKNNVEQNYIMELQEKNIIEPNYIPKVFKFQQNDLMHLNFVWLELTMHCNLKCLHCYEGNIHKKHSDELSLSKWKNVLEQLKENDCKKIQFIGGEPCCNKDLIDLLIYAKTLNFQSITLFTNATLMSDELIDTIKNNNIAVRFSLYGPNAYIHDSVTQTPGSFNKTIANIKKLIALNVIITPAVVILKQNEEFIDEIKSFIISLGLPYAGYDVIRSVYNGTQKCFKPSQEIINAVNKNKPSFTITKEKFIKAYNYNTCLYGKFAISPTGEIMPCVFFRDVSCGNINHQDIKEILHSKELNKYWKLDFSQIDTCKDCEFRFACKDCRPLGYSVCGNTFQKNPRCRYNPYTATWDN